MYCSMGNEKKEPNLNRPFKVPAYKLVVALGVIINIYLIFNLSAHALELSAGWLVLGILSIYSMVKITVN